MNKEFVPYEQALELKELGFNEPCFGYYRKGAVVGNPFEYNIDYCTKVELDHGLSPKNSEFINDWITAPLYQQAFRWFREKYSLEGWVTPLVDWQGFVFKYQSRFHKEGFSVAVVGDYDLKEQAELECLKKLIEIIKNK